jgi:hypothetical protein
MERADLEEQTVDDLLKVLSAEFDDDYSDAQGSEDEHLTADEDGSNDENEY